jgi:hypothetical protein
VAIFAHSPSFSIFSFRCASSALSKAKVVIGVQTWRSEQSFDKARERS